VDPADRISYEPGDQAHCFLWFPEVRIPVGAGMPRVLPVLVMVSSHSRMLRKAFQSPAPGSPLECAIWRATTGPSALFSMTDLKAGTHMKRLHVSCRNLERILIPDV
jgi:hypothetical protein